MKAAVFLDRDDTLIPCNQLPPPPPPAKRGDLIDPALVQLFPGVRESLLDLKRAGYFLILISNQGCVARSGTDLATVDRVNQRLHELLGADDSGRRVLDATLVCPFHPNADPAGPNAAFVAEHPWRKPRPGMISAAAGELRLDLQQCWLVGDAERDVEAGVNAGMPRDRCLQVGPNTVFPDLPAAALHILKHPCPRP